MAKSSFKPAFQPIPDAEIPKVGTLIKRETKDEIFIVLVSTASFQCQNIYVNGTIVLYSNKAVPQRNEVGQFINGMQIATGGRYLTGVTVLSPGDSVTLTQE